MRIPTRSLAAFLVGLWLLAPAPSAADRLVVDLSEPNVAITASFVGADLFLFGVGEERSDVIIVVRGPFQPETVRFKDRVAGVWVNQDEIMFDQVPSYYFVAANRPLADIAPQAILTENRIGIDTLDLKPVGAWRRNTEEVERFREALVRNKQRLGLFGHGPGTVTFLGRGLFRADIHFPANIATGHYGVDTFLFADGKLLNRQTTLLEVNKVGFEARVYDLAYRHSLAYGAIAIIIAAVAGWLANIAFRKV